MVFLVHDPWMCYHTADRRRGGRVDEGNRLLSGYRVKSSVPGSNPGLSAILHGSADRRAMQDSAKG